MSSCTFFGEMRRREFSRRDNATVVDVFACEVHGECSETDHALPTADLAPLGQAADGCRWKGEHLRDCESG